MDLSRKDTDQTLFIAARPAPRTAQFGSGRRGLAQVGVGQGSADSTAILNLSQPGRRGGTGRRSGLSHSANERAGFLTQSFSQTLDMVMIT